MSGFEKQMVGSRGGGYGLDAELARKREAQYDIEAETKAREWIESLTGETMQGPFGDCLRDGLLLVRLINQIEPGIVKRENVSRMPFKQMENISNFLQACRSLGVAEHSLFETVDLFENKDISLVVQCIWALGSTVQQTCPDFKGPHLGAKLHTVNKRTFGPNTKVVISKQTFGSAQVMERSKIVIERHLQQHQRFNAQVTKTGITFGAEYVGTGDTASMSKMSQGSYGVMKRSAMDVSNSVTFGADNAGTGDSSISSKDLTAPQGIRGHLEVRTARSDASKAEEVSDVDTSEPSKNKTGLSPIRMGQDAASLSNNITPFSVDEAALQVPRALACGEGDNNTEVLRTRTETRSRSKPLQKPPISPYQNAQAAGEVQPAVNEELKFGAHDEDPVSEILATVDL